MAKKAKQLHFEGRGLKAPKPVFGGKQFATCNPKTKRPLDSKFPIHLVLRARKGGMRLPKAFLEVNQLVYGTAEKHGVKIYEYANVGNHLHLAIRVLRIQKWSAFIRELTGQLAQLVQNLGIVGKEESFWLYRPFTRILKSWQKAYRDLKDYIELNRLDAEGHISRKDTQSLKELRALFADG